MSLPPPEIEGLNAAHWRRILEEGPLLFVVLGSSMEPTFRAGERVQIRPLKEDEPKCGQVAAYYREILTTHRYVEEGVCRGDNMLNADPPISTEDIVGIVIAVERAGRLRPLRSRMSLAAKIHRLKLHIRQAMRGP